MPVGRELLPARHGAALVRQVGNGLLRRRLCQLRLQERIFLKRPDRTLQHTRPRYGCRLVGPNIES
jgi:hypothetical protein